MSEPIPTADLTDVDALRKAAQVLLDLADETDEEIATNSYWQSELQPRERWYANGVGNALGGPSGNLAGLLSPEAARELAAMFRAWGRMAVVGPEFLGRVGGRETLALARLILDPNPSETTP